MAIEVTWSEEAKKTFDEIVSYLLRKWSEKEVKRFIQQTEYVISRLQEYPESYNPSLKQKQVRRARLNKYTTLYYRYYTTRKKIILLSFWNTRQDPGQLKY
ncbi:type II toxin-antitoxin system RelE/ParE family toxin [Flavihumibacter sp. RY-1]|uniref:Type II toxin-antitoxin system RelE/ParE family toxin n=1 Tax=Flavihumibacter fluminis TaxID=2909236 RepID=A0ABS9BH41_9BACT|nr:type II toxin-antitoxin system RelE/ParE family toxin [Flavihumibacter fluminis]MCF1713981.1 type II toxin-antitoxin system RelE/ParE family toxin [Flavihumibacter fluminis]